MADVHSVSIRSKNMRAIRGKNTTPERIVRKALFAEGFRFRLHVGKLPGKPDIVLPKYKTVIFVHGCFWHQHTDCKYAVYPKSNTTFWKTKLGSNIERDQKNLHSLQELGWNCIVIWECELKKPDYKERLFAAIRQ